MQIPRFALSAILIILANVSLVAANDLIFPQVAAGGGYTTVLTFMHVDLRTTGPATGSVTFYNQDGTPRMVTSAESGSGSSFNLTIPAQGVRVLTITAPGDVGVGAARYRGDSVSIGGVATYSAGAAIVGVLPATPASTAYIPLTIRPGFDTGVAVTNVGTASLDAQFDIIAPSGSVTVGARTTIRPNGQVARLVGPELGFTGSVAPGSVLRISASSGTFGALPLLLGNGYISSGAVLLPGELQSPLYLPQVVVGGGYTMSVTVFNPQSFGVAGTLRFLTTTGQPLRLGVRPAAGGNPSTTDSVDAPSIPALGSMSWDIEAPTAGGGVTTGFAVWESYLPSNAIIRIPALSGIASTIFFGATHVGEMGTTPYHSAAIPVNIGGGQNTGVALANSGSGTSSITRTLRDSSGGAAQTADPLSLPSNNQVAQYANEIFRGTTSAMGFSMVLENTGKDGFLPMALLDTNGVFSSTAVVRRYTVTPQQLAGSFNGSWTNITFGSGGPMRMTIQHLAAANQANILMDLDGNVFGGGDPAPESFTCNLGPEGCNAAFTSVVFGPMTFFVKSDGTLVMRGRPGNGNAFFILDGFMGPNAMTGDYSLGLNALRARGRMDLTK